MVRFIISAGSQSPLRTINSGFILSVTSPFFSVFSRSSRGALRCQTGDAVLPSVPAFNVGGKRHWLAHGCGDCLRRLPVRRLSLLFVPAPIHPAIHTAPEDQHLHGRDADSGGLSEAELPIYLPVCRNGFDVTADLGIGGHEIRFRQGIYLPWARASCFWRTNKSAFTHSVGDLTGFQNTRYLAVCGARRSLLWRLSYPFPDHFGLGSLDRTGRGTEQPSQPARRSNCNSHGGLRTGVGSAPSGRIAWNRIWPSDRSQIPQPSSGRSLLIGTHLRYRPPLLEYQKRTSHTQFEMRGAVNRNGFSQFQPTSNLVLRALISSTA